MLQRAAHALGRCGTLGPIRFTIGSDGSVTAAEGSACLQRVLRGLHFPRLLATDAS